MYANSHHHHDLISYLHGLIALATSYLSIIGAFLIIVAGVLSIIDLCICMYNGMFKTQYKSCFNSGKTASMRNARIQMGHMIATGLELLVATDVLETLSKEVNEFTYDLLGKLLGLAAFRTALAYCLSREVAELQHEDELDHADRDTHTHGPDAKKTK